MEKYNATFKFSQDELAHHLMPREGVVYTLVVEMIEGKERSINDFISMYYLPSQILKKEGHSHDTLHIAYLQYYSCSEENPLVELVKYALHFAKEVCEVKMDVFNCLNIMDNKQFVTELKFGVGDGVLNFYMYNYQLQHGFIQSDKIGTVLV
mmetsp:Transcript_7105/g.11981  ORF Transcript_7105/g.11981 Transcript_7105/m.11981 type:complete len:152 (+) Transcript_7105:1014-1469(+)